MGLSREIEIRILWITRFNTQKWLIRIGYLVQICRYWIKSGPPWAIEPLRTVSNYILNFEGVTWLDVASFSAIENASGSRETWWFSVSLWGSDGFCVIRQLCCDCFGWRLLRVWLRLGHKVRPNMFAKSPLLSITYSGTCSLFRLLGK